MGKFSGLTIKAAIILVAGLVLAQMIFWGVDQSRKVVETNSQASAVSAEVQKLQGEEADLRRKLRETEDELREIASTVPPSLLIGNEDHEARLLALLDYLQTPMISELDLTFDIPKDLKYVAAPMPMHVGDMKFTFAFYHLAELDGILGSVFEQSVYPMHVKELQVDRNKSGGKTKGKITAEYVVPARLSLLATIKE